MHNAPRSYSEALLKATEAQSRTDGGDWLRYKTGEGCVCVIAGEGRAFTTFYDDGRIKITTRGNNNIATMRDVNACLPPGYSVRKSGAHVLLIDARRPDSPIATFLSSTVFTPIGVCHVA